MNIFNETLTIHNNYIYTCNTQKTREAHGASGGVAGENEQPQQGMYPGHCVYNGAGMYKQLYEAYYPSRAHIKRCIAIGYHAHIYSVCGDCLFIAWVYHYQ
jgi:hypothetical protein